MLAKCRELGLWALGAPVEFGGANLPAIALMPVFEELWRTECRSHSIVDQAMRAFGTMGMTKEIPLQLLAQRARVIRIYEEPSEGHRMVIARRILRPFK